MSTIIARNYAETLFALAQRHGGADAVTEFGSAIDGVAELLHREPRIREFLETPRVDAESKKQAIRATFTGRVPDMFLRFLLVLIEKRRQSQLREIARAYHDIVDRALGRVRAEIVLAQEPNAELQREIVTSLERQLGKTVVPRFRVDPEMIGGVVIRVGDQILDGSVRHQLASLRRRMYAASLP